MASETELAAVSAVVRRYYDLLNEPTSLANAASLSALMTRDCVCQQVVEATREAVSKHRVFFGRNRVVSIIANLDASTAADALVTYDYTKSGLKDATGRVISSGAGHIGTTQNFRLIKRNGKWLISTILRVSPGKTA